MDPKELHRRQFNKLAAAAFGGLLAGAGMAFSADKDAKDKEPAKDKKDPDKPLLLQEPHVCRGLNTCKNKGHSAKNDCAGQGDCATVKAHTCKGENDCLGHGGCGAHPGENKCKGMGDCAVPLKEKGWTTARKNYEAAMKKAEKKFGDAPKAKTEAKDK